MVEKVHDMFQQVFLPTDRLMMGQMIWYAVAEKEKAGYGKSLEKRRQRPLIVDVIHETDIEALTRAGRQKRVIALLLVKLEQGRAMTDADVGALMRLSQATICRYVWDDEKETEKILPCGETIHDMERAVQLKADHLQKTLLRKEGDRTGGQRNQPSTAGGCQICE